MSNYSIPAWYEVMPLAEPLLKMEKGEVAKVPFHAFPLMDAHMFTVLWESPCTGHLGFGEWPMPTAGSGGSS